MILFCNLFQHQKKVNKPIYLYAFYNPAIATSAKEQLINEVVELNREYEDYKQKLANAIAKHKKKPEMPSLKSNQETPEFLLHQPHTDGRS